MLDQLFVGVVGQLHAGLGLLWGIGLSAIAVWRLAYLRKRRRTSQKIDAIWPNTVYEHVELGMNLTTPEGYLVRVNQAYCKIFGYSSTQLLHGMRWQDLTQPEDLVEEKALVPYGRPERMTAFALEQRCIRGDGTIIWVKVHASPVYNEDGQVQFIAGVVEDISDRKAAQFALERSERELRAMFASMTDVVLTLSKEGRYLKITSPSTDLLLQPVEKLLGRMVHDVFPPTDADHIVQCIQQVLTTGDVTYLEYPVQIQGKTLWFAANMSPLSPDSVICVARDISDRHQAEQALRRSEATNRAILEAIPDLLLRIQRDGTYVAVVESNKHKPVGILPYTIGSHIYETLPWALAHQRMTAITAALETGRLQVYEQSITVNDVVQEEEVRVIAINDQETLVMVRDIQDRKRAERALQHQANLERALNQVTQTIRNSLDAMTTYTTAVREFAHILEAQQAVLAEYCPAEQLWRNIAFYGNSPDQPQMEGFEVPDENNAIAAQLKRGEIVIFANAATCQDPTNRQLAQLFPGSWLTLPIYFQDKLWGGLTLVRATGGWQEADIQLAKAITNQLAIAIQQAELYQQLQQLNTHLEQQVEERTAVIQKALTFESLLKRITDKVRDSLDENQILQTAVNELGQALEVLCCNASLYTADLASGKITHEYSTQESFGLGLEILFELPTVKQIMQQLKQAQTLQVCFPKQEFMTVQEEYYTVLMCPMLDDQGLLGDLWLFRPKEDTFSDLEIRIVQQVTNHCAIALRQSRLYQAAQAQVDELARLNQLKDDFLSTVSHELRTPMSNIKMATQMLEINLEQLGVLEAESDRVNVYLTILQEECKRETNLINDLLDLSRLDSGSDPLVISSMDLTYWLPHIAEVFTERMFLAQQRLVLELHDEITTLTTDFAYLELVLMELLHNACKYTPHGETIKITTGPMASTDGGTHGCQEKWLQIQIANSGVEIPPEEQCHVFDKFYRVPNNDPWKHGGTGLGLALVKKRVERLQGAIAVTSLNQWTTFTLQLPQLAEVRPQPSDLACSWNY
jgi:PAS domain S-box-containing protein